MFRYHITQEDFKEMTILLMKQKSAQTSAKVKLVLFTVVQMSLIGYMIVKGTQVMPIIRILMGIMSVVWAGQTVFSFGCYEARAKMALSSQKDNDPNGDFWKEHRLQLKNGRLDIGYGQQSAALECAQLTKVDETEHLTLLMSGSNIFELVPKSVSEQPAFKAFLEEVRTIAAQKLRDAQAAQRGDVLTSAYFSEYLPISEDEMVAKQIRMKRLSFLTPTGWTKVSFLVFVVPLVILFIAIWNRTPLYIAAAVIFFLLTNAGTLMIFTKLYEKTVRKQLLPAGEEGYLLAVTERKVHWFTREYHFSYDIQEIRSVIDRADASYYYLPGREMFFVPAYCRDEFKAALNKRRSLTDITGGRKAEDDD